MNKQSTTGSIGAAMPVTSAADTLYSQIQGVFQQARQRAQAQRQPDLERRCPPRPSCRLN